MYDMTGKGKILERNDMTMHLAFWFGRGETFHHLNSKEGRDGTVYN